MEEDEELLVRVLVVSEPCSVVVVEGHGSVLVVFEGRDGTDKWELLEAW